MDDKILTVGTCEGKAIDWIAVSEDYESITLLSKEVLFTSRFGDNKSFAESDILKKLADTIVITADEREIFEFISADELGNSISIPSYAEALEYKFKHRLCNCYFYWLRSPYPSSYSRALMVNSDGSGSHAGTDDSSGGVRPIIKIRKF